MFTAETLLHTALNETSPRRRAASVLAVAGLALRDLHGLSADNIVQAPPRLPGVRETSRSLTMDAARRLWALTENAPLSERLAVRLCMVLGMRQVEVRRLRVLDVAESGLGALSLNVRGKGGSTRTVYLPDSLARDVLTAMEGRTGTDALVAPGRSRVHRNTMRKMIEPWLQRADADATPHALRHTSLTWLLRTGATLDEAMEIAGHTSVRSHAVYAAADNGWFEESWWAHHPMAGWVEGDSRELWHIYVPGEPADRQVTKDSERVVPIPARVAQRILLPAMHEGGWPLSRSQVIESMRAADHTLSGLREATAALMAESGAHPFLISLILGVTPEHVVDQGYERKGPEAELGRRRALDRVDEAFRGIRLDAQRMAG